MVLKIRKDGAWVNISPKANGLIKATASGALSAGDPVVLNSDGTVSKVSISTRTTKFEEGPSTPYNGSNSQYDTYSWTVDDGITELSVVCIGGGGGGGSKNGDYGGGGAGLGHIIMDVTPGDVIEYQVGAGGEGGIWYPTGGSPPDKHGQDGGDTWLKNASGDKVVSGGGGEGVSNSEGPAEGEGGTYIGDGGGVGGQGGYTENLVGEYFGAGGGGAGGYSGNGGKGGNGEDASNNGGEDGEDGSGGGGGGGGSDADGIGDDEGAGGGGGGTGILGEHSPVASGTGGEKSEYGGYGGEGGSWTGEEGDGERGGISGPGDDQGGDGGYYGGGGGKASDLFSSTPYVPGGDGGRGAIRIVGSGSNLTANNFLGFSEAAYANSDTATINIFSSVNTNQSGLLQVGKKYYVQDDGTLSTTPGHIRVEAGTALSSTNILVSGGAALKLEGTTRPFNTSGWKIPLVG